MRSDGRMRGGDAGKLGRWHQKANKGWEVEVVHLEAGARQEAGAH
jgi:hypothetical protein